MADDFLCMSCGGCYQTGTAKSDKCPRCGNANVIKIDLAKLFGGG